jgi:hypothetical protein
VSPRLLSWVFLVSGCFYVTEAERVERWDLAGDGLERPEDCDDADPALGALSVWYADTDEDGARDPLQPVQSWGQPDGRVAVAGDCDDHDPTSFPGGQERCDGHDNDCDLSVDEELPELTWYRDADGDGYGDEAATEEDCAMPDGFVAVAGDCDDGDGLVNPEAQEECGGDGAPVDEDCDELVDLDDPDVVPPVWYPDADGDGHGAEPGVASCVQPPDTVATADDCDDGDGGIGVGWTYYEDVDGDGFGNTLNVLISCLAPPIDGWTLMPGDCNDEDETVVPPC